MTFENIKYCKDTYELGVYPKRNLAIVKGQGETLWDSEGNTYVDCTSGVSVANVGHCNPKVAAAICEQASTLITCYSIMYNEQRAQLLKRLVDVSPAHYEKVFYVIPDRISGSGHQGGPYNNGEN